MMGHGNGVQGQWDIDTEEEFEETYNELMNNADMSYLGDFDLTQDIDEELEYQGFTLEEINTMSLARYGAVLEVLSYEDRYYAFIGSR